MIVDFHTHVFPDNMAARVISALSAGIDEVFTPVNDGTVSGLINDMDNWNIDTAVVQPVVTKQSQTKSINDWSRSICSDRIISFGGIYPHTDDYKRDIDYVAGLGLKGLKFHAEYQNFIVDDDKMLKIYDYALGKGLILFHHAGADPAFPPPFKSTPQQFAKIAKAMRGGVIVAAHFGGHAQWDDVEKYLVGTDIYLDTSMGFDYFSHDQFLRIVKSHGADKILFASDYPWSNAKLEMEQLRGLSLSSEEIDAILGGNAKRVLKV
jgi:predicted TIM-barrel fold metal-dependent hydrolase